MTSPIILTTFSISDIRVFFFGLFIQESLSSNSSHSTPFFVGEKKHEEQRRIIHLVMQGSDTFKKKGKLKAFFPRNK
jgi:hypothetical protein